MGRPPINCAAEIAAAKGRTDDIPHLESGRVTALAGAPEFALPAYVVYPTDSDPAVFDLALDGLRQVSASEER